MASGTKKRRQSIEVFRLRLRETVNEGDEGDDGESVASSSTRSLLSLPENEPALPSPKNGEARPQQTAQQKETQPRQEQPVARLERTVSRQDTRRRLRVEINIDEDSDEEFAPGQEIKIDNDSGDEDIDGREPSERRKPCLIASSSSGDDGSTRTMRCSLDAAESAPTATDVHVIEAVAELDENVDSTEHNELLTPEEPEATETAQLQTVPRNKISPTAQPTDSIRESRRVVLVTRPSQRYVRYLSTASQVVV
jgi:hypothetical protein